MKPRQTISKLIVVCLVTFILNSPGAALAQVVPASDLTESNLIPSPCSLKLDGRVVNYASLWVNPAGQTMVSLRDTVLLFSCHLEYKVDGSVLLHHLDQEQTYSPFQYICTGSIENYTPLQRLDTVYLPLRSVAAGFDYNLIYNPQRPSIQLQSPTFQTTNPEPDPADEEAYPSPSEDLPNWGMLNSELAARWPGARIIGAYYTKLINSPEGRTNNIILSCTKLNGQILQDGEILSFNRTVGARTITAGYREAKIFVGQTVQSGLGGGICQTATTLYNAGLEAGMEIVERYRHTLPVAYCPPKRDATVSWGGVDLKIKNNLGRPVKLLCCVYGDYVLAAFVETKINQD